MRINRSKFFVYALLLFCGMISGCTKTEMEVVDISGMQPEEIFELCKEDLTKLAENTIAYAGELQVFCKDNKLDVSSFSEDEMAFIDMSMNSDKAKELEEIMVMLNSNRLVANYDNEIDPNTPFKISIRVDTIYGEYFYYFPGRKILDEELVERTHKEIIDLGDGWYYMRLYEMPD